MRARTVAAVVVAVLMVAVVGAVAAPSWNDDLDQRVTALEDRVDALEAEVFTTEEPSPEPSPSPTETVSPSPSPSPSPTATESPSPDPSPTPSPSPSPTATETPSPEPTEDPTTPPPTGFPDATTTGVVDESALTPSSTVSTTHDGQVIEDLEVTGMISVSHSNVTIRNVRVLQTGRYGIAVPHTLHSDVKGLLVEDVEVHGISGTRSACIVHYGEWTVRRANIHGCADLVKMLSNQVLEDSYLHDPVVIEDSHNDGVQTVGGSNSVIRGNSISNPLSQTSAIILQSNNGPVDNWTIEGNLLSGGGFTVYLRDKGTGHGPPSNMTVRNNVWVSDSWHFGPLSYDQGPGWVWEGNTFDNGTPFELS